MQEGTRQRLIVVVTQIHEMLFSNYDRKHPRSDCFKNYPINVQGYPA